MDQESLLKRQLAASLVRNYFSGQITRFEFFERYPEHSTDPKLIYFYTTIDRERQPNRFFGPSKEEHAHYVKEALRLADEAETNTLTAVTMYRLFKELWFSSNQCKEPIQNIGIRLLEVAKSTHNSRDDIRDYFHALLKQEYLELFSKEPLLYRFTEKGKRIKTEADVAQLINDIS